MTAPGTLLGGLSTAELTALREHAHRAVMRLFVASAGVYARMSQMPTWTPAYRELDALAAAQLAAGREQHELFTEVGDIIRLRLEEADLQDRIAAGRASLATIMSIPDETARRNAILNWSPSHDR